MFRNSNSRKIYTIALNLFRQMLSSGYGLIIPFFIIKWESKDLWGAFTEILLFTMFSTIVFNWGSKEHLLRKFSKIPSEIKKTFSEDLLMRLPLLMVFMVVAYLFFTAENAFWIGCWMFGRFLSYSFEVVVLYKKKFRLSLLFETLSFFVFFCLIYFTSEKIGLSLNFLLIFYSLYQLLKGLLFTIYFKDLLSFRNARFDPKYFKYTFSFFLLALVGFLASKLDVYLAGIFFTKKDLSEYQIINNLLLFTMSLTSLIYSPFTKILYRSPSQSFQKQKKLLAFIGLPVALLSSILIYFVLNLYFEFHLKAIFIIISILYIYPVYIYSLDVVNLFKHHKEANVVRCLTTGVFINAVFGGIFLYIETNLYSLLFATIISQICILILIKNQSRHLLEPN